MIGKLLLTSTVLALNRNTSLHARLARKTLCYLFLSLLSLLLAAKSFADRAHTSDRFEAHGRFGLKLEQADRSLHLQGLFEVRIDQQQALVELYDPAGQRLMLWRQEPSGEALIETARDGASSATLAQRWLAQQGIRIDIEQLDAWRWRRWLELDAGRFKQGSLIIERKIGRAHV